MGQGARWPEMSSRTLVAFCVVLSVALTGCDKLIEAIAVLFLLTVLLVADVLALVGLGVAFFSSRPPHLVHLILSYLMLGVFGFGVATLDQTVGISKHEMLHLLAFGLPLGLPILLWPLWATVIHFHKQPDRPQAPVVVGAVISMAILVGLGVYGRTYGPTLLPIAPITITPEVARFRVLVDEAKRAQLPTTVAEAPRAPARVERGPVPARPPWSLLLSVGTPLLADDVPMLPVESSDLGIVEARAYKTTELRIVAWELTDRAAARGARDAMLRWADDAKIHFAKLAQNEKVLLAIGFVDAGTVPPAREAARMRFVKAFDATAD